MTHFLYGWIDCDDTATTERVLRAQDGIEAVARSLDLHVQWGSEMTEPEVRTNISVLRSRSCTSPSDFMIVSNDAPTNADNIVNSYALMAGRRNNFQPLKTSLMRVERLVAHMLTVLDADSMVVIASDGDPPFASMVECDLVHLRDVIVEHCIERDGPPDILVKVVRLPSSVQ